MTITIGARLGPYEIQSALGAGGMGEVYRARDTKLNRDVALKILPEAFTLDGDRIARFRREAQVLASLNHPNIAAIYGFEDSGSTHALVLELVEGPTLADRIAKGPIPLDEALPIARQIAGALEAAHEQGIIHRDLKPANIKVRDDGTVKVLDFGLAKAMEPTATLSASASKSPTITTPAMMTGVGMILGTAAYMSPEQARGRPADKRSDIWAFGCVLYEMLTGKRAFDGDDVADTLASVLKADADWSALSDTPPAIRSLIKGCLERGLQQRIGDIAAAKFVLRDPTLGIGMGPVPTPVVVPEPLWRRVIPIAVAAAAVGAAGVIVGRSIQPTLPAAHVTRFSYTLPADQRLEEVGGQIIAISPDGSHIAYLANRRAYLRALSDFEARPIPGTDAGERDNRLAALAFSPDGQSIGVWGSNLLRGPFKKTPLGGGAGVVLTQLSPFSLGLTWHSEGLLIAERGTGIVRISQDGHRDVLVKTTDGLIAAPQILPDGDTLLYAFAPGVTEPTGASPDTWDKAKIIIHSLKSGEEKTIVDGGGAPTYVRSGHLLYVVGGTLFAVPFDYRRRELTGAVASMVEGVARPSFTNAAPPTVYYGVSDNGTLIYIPGPASLTTGQFRLAMVSVDGRLDPLKLEPGSYVVPRASPDGKRIAFGTIDKNTNVWIYDLAGTSAARQLTIGGKNRYPVWSGDGARVAFQSDREGDFAIYAQRADGNAPAERLTRPASGITHTPESWSPDGRTLLYSEQKGNDFTLWGLSLPDKKPFRFGGIQSWSDPPSAMFSPDGKWVAYLATDSGGTRTVFVEPFPANGVKHPIGTAIWHPAWSADGKALYYRAAGAREYVVRVSTQPSFVVSNPELLTPVPFESRGRVEREYDVTRDGRIIGIVATGASQDRAAASASDGRYINTSGSLVGTAQQINVVVNWTEELKQRVPTK